MACASLAAAAQTYVQPYVTKNGTYVQGHYRSSPNDTKVDNYSSQGNTNPYTGKAGTVDPYKYQAPTYPTYQAPTYPTYQAPTYPKSNCTGFYCN